MKITQRQLRKIIREASREAKNHPLNDLAHRQQRTFGGGTLVDPEGFTDLIQVGIDFTKEKAATPLRMSEARLRSFIRSILIEQVVGYQTPSQQKQAEQDPDYLDDGTVGVGAPEGSQEDTEASADSVKSLTQTRQKQLDSGSTVDAEESGRELSQLRRRRG